MGSPRTVGESFSVTFLLHGAPKLDTEGRKEAGSR